MKYLVLILVSLLFTPSAFAASNTGGDWPIYVYGSAEDVQSIFAFVSSIVTDGFAKTVMILGATIGIWFAGLKLKDGDLKGGVARFGWAIATVAFFLYPNTTVHIYDKRIDHGIIPGTSGTYAVQAEVPFFLAFVTSGASTITAELSEMVSAASAPVNTALEYNSVGFGTPFAALKNMFESGGMNGDANASRQMSKISAYLSSCVFKAVSTNNTLRHFLTAPTTDYFTALAPANFTSGGIGSLQVVFEGSSYSCTNFYNNTVNTNTVKDPITNFLVARLKSNFPDFNTTASFSSLLTGVNSILQPPGVTVATNLSAIEGKMLSARMAATINAGLQKSGTGIAGIDSAIAGTMERSRQNLLVEGIGSFSWLIEIIPMAMQILFMIIIGMYIPMAIVAMASGFEKGSKIFLNYAMGIVSFLTVNVTFAFIQNLVQMHGASKIQGVWDTYGTNALTIAATPDMISEVVTMAGLAGALGAVAIPFTIGIVFKGETAAATSILSGVKGMYAGNTLKNAQSDGIRAGANQAQQNLQNQMAMEDFNKLDGDTKKSMSKDEKADWLSRHGFDEGMGTAETARVYGQIQNEMASLGGGFAAMSAMTSGGQTQDIAMGQRLQGEKSVQSTASYGREMSNGRTAVESLEVANFSGQLAGGSQAHQDIGTVGAVKAVKGGFEEYMNGAENQAVLSASQTMGAGKDGRLLEDSGNFSKISSDMRERADADEKAAKSLEEEANSKSGLDKEKLLQKAKDKKAEAKSLRKAADELDNDGGVVPSLVNASALAFNRNVGNMVGTGTEVGDDAAKIGATVGIMEGVRSGAEVKTLSERGNVAAFRASGNMNALKTIGDTEAALHSQVTDDEGNLQTAANLGKHVEENKKRLADIEKEMQDEESGAAGHGKGRGKHWKALNAEKEMLKSRIEAGEKFNKMQKGLNDAQAEIEKIHDNVTKGDLSKERIDQLESQASDAEFEEKKHIANAKALDAKIDDNDRKIAENKKELKDAVPNSIDAIAKAQTIKSLEEENESMRNAIGTEEKAATKERDRASSLRNKVGDTKFDRDKAISRAGELGASARATAEELRSMADTNANTEIDGFTAGVERMARSGINKTIGVGKADFLDSKGNHVSEEQYMANLQKSSSTSFMADGIKGAEAAKGLNVSHNAEGYIDGMTLNKDMAEGIARGEMGNIAQTKGKAHARIKDKDGKDREVTDDEYMKNAEASSIERETSGQTHASKMRENYGDKLETGKTESIAEGLTKEDAETLAELHAKQKKVAAKVNSDMTNLGKTEEALAKEPRLADIKGFSQKHQANKDAAESSQNELDTIGDKINALEEKRDKPTDVTKTFSGVAGSIEQSKIDSQFGQSVGVDKNMGKNPSIYATNAEYSEMQRQQTTAAKIATQGGVNAAVATDVAESAMKAAAQQGATKGQVQEMAKSAGMNSADAKKFAEAITSGAQSAKELIASGITGAAASLAGALSGGKTASDLAKVEAHGDTDTFVQAQRTSGLRDGATSMTQNIKAGEELTAQRQVEGIMNTVRPSDLNSTLKSLKDYGMVTEDSTLNNIQATQGEQFLKGKAAASAAAMSKDDRLQVGKYSFNISSDVNSADTRVEATDASGLTTGRYVHDRTGVNIMNPAQKALASAGVDPTDAYMTNGRLTPNSNGAPAKADDDSTTAGEIAGVGVELIKDAGLAVGANQATKYLRKKELPMTKEDLAKQGYSPVDGEPDTFQNDKGDIVEVNKDGKVVDAEGKIKTKPNPKAKTGLIYEGGEKILNASGNALNRISPFSKTKEPLEPTNDGSPDKKDSNPDQGAGDKTKQNTPPNSNSEPSVTQNSKQGKSYKDVLSDFEEMKNTPPEEFAKKDIKQRVAEARSDLDYDLEQGNIDKKEYAKKSNALNNVNRNLESGKDVSIRDLDNAGVDTDDLVTKDTPTRNGKSFQSVDLEASGKFDKHEAIKNAKPIADAAEKMKPSGLEAPDTTPQPSGTVLDAPQHIDTSTPHADAPHTNTPSISSKAKAAISAIEHAHGAKARIGLAAATLLSGTASAADVWDAVTSVSSDKSARDNTAALLDIADPTMGGISSFNEAMHKNNDEVTPALRETPQLWANNVTGMMNSVASMFGLSSTPKSSRKLHHAEMSHGKSSSDNVAPLKITGDDRGYNDDVDSGGNDNFLHPTLNTARPTTTKNTTRNKSDDVDSQAPQQPQQPQPTSSYDANAPQPLNSQVQTPKTPDAPQQPQPTSSYDANAPQQPQPLNGQAPQQPQPLNGQAPQQPQPLNSQVQTPISETAKASIDTPSSKINSSRTSTSSSVDAQGRVNLNASSDEAVDSSYGNDDIVPQQSKSSSGYKANNAPQSQKRGYDTSSVDTLQSSGGYETANSPQSLNNSNEAQAPQAPNAPTDAQSGGYATQMYSLAAATAMTNMATSQPHGSEVQSSMNAQIQGFHAQIASKNALENLAQLQQFANPDLGLQGVTMHTSAGDLALSRSSDGYLNIGEGSNAIQTAIPMQDFQNSVSSGNMAQSLSSAIASSYVSNKEPDNLMGGHNVVMRDTDNLLSEMSMKQSEAASDSKIVNSSSYEVQEASFEHLETVAEKISDIAEKLGATRNEEF